MENRPPLLEWKGYVIGIAAFLGTLSIFYSLSYALFYSFLGAALAAFLTWGGYIVLRMIYFAASLKE